MLAKGFAGMVERARIEGATRSLGMINQHGWSGGSGSSTMLKQQRDAISSKLKSSVYHNVGDAKKALKAGKSEISGDIDYATFEAGLTKMLHVTAERLKDE